MILRWKLTLAGVVLAAMPAAAFALDDAGSTGTADASTPTADAGPAADVTATSPDVSSADTGSGSFNENPCWDSKCATETAACKASANCTKLVGCIKAKDTKCQQDIGNSDKAAVDLLNAIADCGYKQCNDPTKGTCKDNCGKFMGNAAPCNCDKACKQYGDCCQDYDQLCGSAGGTCKDKCGQYIAKDPCFCDEACVDNGDCCPDYDKLCGGSSGADTSTAADTSSCAPKCAGKNCGDDDGCGGKCNGPCPGGGACNASKTCVGGTGGSDAAASADSGAKGDTGATGGAKDGGATGGLADTATTATPVVNNGNNSSSSGCTAGGTSTGGLGLGLALMALIGAILLRRRTA